MNTITVSADQLKTGDAIYGRNGHGTTSLTVTGVLIQDDVVTAFTRLGDREYRAEELLEVAR